VRIVFTGRDTKSDEYRKNIKSKIRVRKNRRAMYAKLSIIMSIANMALLGYIIWLLQKV
jgi:hypothetical protein